jgi:L-ascorbate metabolism protein UlaG (beta-lactamase superfamily)
MNITKLGHCCLLIEHKGVKILTDPGVFTLEAQEQVTGIDIILITHEHQDHFHIESLKKILLHNRDAIVVTNDAVGAYLTKEAIAYAQVCDGDSSELKGIKFEGFGKDHAEIYGTMGLVTNTGYFLDDIFYFPGDNFYPPKLGQAIRPVDILALPVAGPWVKMSMAIDFAKLIKPRTAFGVHDGMILPFFRGFVGEALKMFVPETAYVSLADGESREF